MDSIEFTPRMVPLESGKCSEFEREGDKHGTYEYRRTKDEDYPKNAFS